MISHIVGGAFAIAALVLCVIIAVLHQNVWGVVGSAIYGSTMIILYTMSSIYHGLKAGTGKKVFQVIDHCAVFLLIAGTYTPITLVGIREASPFWGWLVFGIVWAAAIVGIVLNAIDLKRYKVFSMICYVGTGWSILIAIPIALEALQAAALSLILAGGVAYTVGAILYGLGKKRAYMHSVFHLLVLAGSILHFVAIAFFIL
jgi:hemolysin III